jgi:hypothetical protein
MGLIYEKTIICADGFFGFIGTTGVLSASVSDFVVWDGRLSIPD